MTSSFRADLHCHTTCSDGSLSPHEILLLAKKIGLSALSITDHDTVEAYQTALPFAKELNIELITGVEFSTMLQGVSVHVLGYGFSPTDPHILSLCHQHIKRRHDRNSQILTLLAKHQMFISESDLLEGNCGPQDSLKKTIGRPHIAMAMVKKGYVDSVYDAFKRYLAEDKPCYAQGESFSIEETIETIHKAKGVAVIAHPHLQKSNKTIKKLLEMNFDGIEGYYGNFPPRRHRPWLKIAPTKNLLVTGGSDFHGDIKPHIPLGSSWIDEEKFQALLKAISLK